MGKTGAGDGMMKQVANDGVSNALTMERISMLLDGEMDRVEAEAAIAALCADPAFRRQWHELHRAGDALRSNEVAACDAAHFCARVTAALAGEPTVLAPRGGRSTSGVRRYWMPGVAIAASVAAIGFIAVPLLRAPETASIAKNVAQPVVEVSALDPARKSLPTIVNARVAVDAFNPYLAAHRELTSSSVVPRAAAYLRSSATEER